MSSSTSIAICLVLLWKGQEWFIFYNGPRTMMTIKQCINSRNFWAKYSTNSIVRRIDWYRTWDWYSWFVGDENGFLRIEYENIPFSKEFHLFWLKFIEILSLFSMFVSTLWTFGTTNSFFKIIKSFRCLKTSDATIVLLCSTSAWAQQ